MESVTTGWIERKETNFIEIQVPCMLDRKKAIEIK